MIDTQVLVGFLLTILPVSELRGGLPVIIEYAVRNGLSIWPYFLIVLVLNVLVILLIFMFFDFVHGVLMRLEWYRAVMGRILKRLQGKVRRVRDKMDRWGYFALMFFVAIPLPGTGAWTGGLVAWMLGLDRMKSFVAIAAGVVIAGLIVLLVSFGFFNGLY